MKKIVCFGEAVLRLGGVGIEPLLASSTLRCYFGGAEANVAVSLAHFGLDARFTTVLPENRLGDACLSELRRHGVNTDSVRRALGRMGLYFLSPGALLRPAQIIYDRAESAFARADAAGYDWDALLQDACWLHLTGITPALSKAAESAWLDAAAAASKHGIPISFDCNFRPALWRGRERDASQILRAVAEKASLLFGGPRDAELLFGDDVGADPPESAFRRAAATIFAACPKLEYIATNHRVVHTAENHELTGFLAERRGIYATAPMTLQPIVDRIGSGDAFAAGVLFGLCQKLGAQQTLEFALAAAALKHGLAGDLNMASALDVFSLLQSRNRDVQR